MDRSLTRRAWLAGCGGLGVGAAARDARALGRIPSDGKMALVLPWPVSSVDPHDQFDAAAALLGQCIFDQLYAVEGTTEPYPTLAADPPETRGGKTLVRLREGLLTAKNKRLDARDVAFSIERARRGGAIAWWGDLPTPALVPTDSLALTFATSDAAKLARTLASPFFAVVPRGFDPKAPDGTGAMAAEIAGTRLLLRRNANAARGASFLAEVTVEQAPDLLTSLRSFEGNLSDVGWLSSGLHAPRPGAAPFDFGSVGWIVLATGNEAGPWGSPGMAQRIVDGLEPGRLQRFGLGALASSPPQNGAEWGGKPCELLVGEGSAYLEELARTVAALVSRPSHEVTVKTLPLAELARRRTAGAFSLSLGVVRPFGPGGIGALVSLGAASDPASGLELMRRPPRLASFAPRTLTRTLKLGVLGDFRVAGAQAPGVHLARNPLAEGWDLGASYRAAPST
jgi:peptide/nickel transport system substrate-binding protein